MSAQHDIMEQNSIPQYERAHSEHPKSDRAEAKRSDIKASSKNRGPAYPPKNRFQPSVADKATLGDNAAHSYDDDKLCPKLLPVARQEFRGCKKRDLDRRAKAWNKKVYLGLIPSHDLSGTEE
ncbi:hypothetical protein J7T55_006677 [Diaporthe amygdali]|uniref:uncharacterized protein n=1 Tax=Phomopsis amygdali TaxID=1214568 RepID=UPI0022FEA502|nr:uncharacterized protein J7T55_006677 [Diaporthe amygdali]KAJ0125331.1 hypothetical protein J7T55_006677 [Diaporthe amygdali]